MAASFTTEGSSPHPNGTLASPLAPSVDFVLATLGDTVELVGLAGTVAAVSAMVAGRPAQASKRWSGRAEVEGRIMRTKGW